MLEFPKILARLKAYAGFTGSADLAESLRPTSSLEKALDLQQQTREARLLISHYSDLSFQGAVDLRPMVDQTLHGITLEAVELLAIRNTLVISRNAKRVFEEHAPDALSLAGHAANLSEGLGLVDLINKTISERGEVLDGASEALSRIRSEMKVTHARLMERLSRYLNDPNSAHMLQEALITQRGGRYVLPLKSEFKGRIKAIIHDQSASGATLFIEPIAVVEWNNKYRELELQERDEVLRVLRELSVRVAEQAESLNMTMAAMSILDLALMKARYADDLGAVEPVLLPFIPNPSPHHPGSTIRLRRARHPLLDPAKAVPIDFELDPETFSVVLTGPNTGGKTVTLKTVGLAVLMAQSGLQVLAQSGSQLSVFRDVFADIGDEQSIEQSLSTFSGHITQLVRVLKKADYRSLVLLDELGAGTDPQEGSALARAVLSHLLNRRITCVVATHYPELKAFAHATKGVTNASLEFDLETLRPTYHLIIGLPGRSNALAIAERLGLRQDIIDAARSELDPTELHAEDLLDEIHRQRDLARENYEASEKARREAEAARQKTSARLAQLEADKNAILQKAEGQAEAELEALRAELEKMRREMARMKEPAEKTEQVTQLLENLAVVEEQQEKKAKKQARAPRPRRPEGQIQVGEKVLVRRLGTEGTVMSVDAEGLEIQVGMLRLRVRPTDVDRRVAVVEPVAVEKLAAVVTGRTALPTVDSPGLELDLRGQRVDEALDALDSYLERGFTAGLIFGRIIHGRGTGALRQAIREALRQSSYIKRWESGGEKEGGDGVSVVFFEGH